MTQDILDCCQRAGTHGRSASPIRLFRHGLQVWYSRTKGGVDGVPRYRAILRVSTTSLGCDQKVIMQTCKMLLSNAFISWRFVEWASLNGDCSFENLNQFRTTLNKMESFDDFVGHNMKELL